MSRAFGFLCALAALGSASLELGYACAQGGASLSLDSTQTLNDNLDPTMVIVVAITICAFFLMGFFSVYIRHCSEESAARAPSVRLVPAGAGGNSRCLGRGLDPGLVGSFPVLAYVALKYHKLGKGALECAVCLTDFDDFDSLKILPKCEHGFHLECIDAWLASHVTCPVCRANQTPDPCLHQVAAESAVDPRPISQRRVEEEEHQPGRQQPPPSDEVQNEVRINIGGGGDEELGATAAARSRAVAGKLLKSHSTGHLLARPGPLRTEVAGGSEEADKGGGEREDGDEAVDKLQRSVGNRREFEGWTASLGGDAVVSVEGG